MTSATAMRDSLIEQRIVIPRPLVKGCEFVPTLGRRGYYRTIRESGAAKYGLAIKPQGTRRAPLNASLFVRPDTLREEDEDEKVVHNNTQPPQTQKRERISPSSGISSSSSQPSSTYSLSSVSSGSSSPGSGPSPTRFSRR